MRPQLDAIHLVVEGDRAAIVDTGTTQSVRGVGAAIELPAGARQETGSAREELSQLEGRAYTPVVPSAWTGWSGAATEDRAQVEWVVRAWAGATVSLTARHERAGAIRVDVRLE